MLLFYCRIVGNTYHKTWLLVTYAVIKELIICLLFNYESKIEYLPSGESLRKPGPVHPRPPPCLSFDFRLVVVVDAAEAGEAALSTQ
jgi:hypothetical protein